MLVVAASTFVFLILSSPTPGTVGGSLEKQTEAEGAIEMEGVGVVSNKNKMTVPAGNNYQLIQKIISCESSGRHTNVWGDLDYKHPAYGVAQFQERTFNWMRGLAGRNDLEWKNKEDQLWLLAWALENGKGKFWTCYRKVTN